MTNHEYSWPQIIGKSRISQELTPDEIKWAMKEAMSGNATDAQIAGLLTALQPVNLTPDELHHFGEEMTSHATSIKPFHDGVDIVGTGGDQLNTVNISTMASLVVAACGIPVVKHGNRASSSSTGSADVIEALGVNLNQEISKVEASIETIGVGFLFAQVFHPAMRFIAPVRKQLGIPTVFNYLGPLTNPAKPLNSVIGVANSELVNTIAQAFQQRKNAHTLVVRGHNVLDEISICGPSTIIKASPDGIESLEITPEEFGFKSADISEIRGGFAEENAQVVLDFLKGKQGAVRDAVLLNAAAGIYVHDYFDQNLHEGFSSALKIAAEAVDSGKALAKLEEWKAYSGS